MSNVQAAYNNATQTFAATGGTIQILGTQTADVGCAIDTDGGGFVIRASGVYRISYDILFDASAVGSAVIQMNSGTTVLPCAYSAFATADGTVYPVHIETTIPVRACYGVQPVISVSISGAAGDVTHVCASAVKVA